MSIIAGNTKIGKYTLPNGEKISLKREDLNPSGSFKDRLVEFLLPQLLNTPEDEIVVSSSGNLAISLLYFLKDKSEKKLKIFVKDNLPKLKLDKLNELLGQNSELVFSAKPKSDCFKYAKVHKAFWLRNSEGETYSLAYWPLATEILEYEAETGVDFDAVFVCTSSATAAVGIMQKFLAEKRILPVYLVQTSHINSIAKDFDTDFTSEATTLANAISDRVAKRKTEAVKLAKEVRGGGVVLENEQISQALATLEQLIPAKSWTGNAALSLAAFFKLQKKGYNLKNPLIIISGN